MLRGYAKRSPSERQHGKLPRQLKGYLQFRAAGLGSRSTETSLLEFLLFFGLRQNENHHPSLPFDRWTSQEG
jgi:hypothetical protein